MRGGSRTTGRKEERDPFAHIPTSNDEPISFLPGEGGSSSESEYDSDNYGVQYYRNSS